METHLRQHINKTKREVISEIIALLFFVILSFAIKAHDSEFNTNQFIIDAKTIHLTQDEIPKFEAIPDTAVRSELDKFIDYDKSLFSTALDDICENIVGRTMFKILIIKLTPCSRIRITDIGYEQSYDERPLSKQKGSAYSHTTYTVKINTNFYNNSGTGISERQYYCVDKNSNITLKPKYVTNSMFHEFTHCLHHIGDGMRYEAYRRASTPALWTNREERRTISGYVEADCYTATDVYDPICDNCFVLCNPTGSGIPRCPRIGHIGYMKGKREYSDKDLSQFYQTSNANFNLAWPEQYLISSEA
jgi:hypothetical protein